MKEHSRDSKDLLRLSGELLALGAALLPVIGGAVRAIAFALTPVHADPITFGWSAPLSDLIANGVASLIAPTLLILVAFVGTRNSPKRPSVERWRIVAGRFLPRMQLLWH